MLGKNARSITTALVTVFAIAAGVCGATAAPNQPGTNTYEGAPNQPNSKPNPPKPKPQTERDYEVRLTNEMVGVTVLLHGIVDHNRPGSIGQTMVFGKLKKDSSPGRQTLSFKINSDDKVDFGFVVECALSNGGKNVSITNHNYKGPAVREITFSGDEKGCKTTPPGT